MDALTPAGRLFGRSRHELRLSPAGLPDYGRGASVHSVSNHRRDDRGLPGCPAIRLLAYRPLCRPGLSLEDSPILTNRIEFTAAAHSGHLCYGLVVLVPLLSTSHCCNAVTVRYRTILHRTGADFHCSIPSPSGARAHAPPRAANGASPLASHSDNQALERFKQTCDRLCLGEHTRPRVWRLAPSPVAPPLGASPPRFARKTRPS